MLYRSTSTAVDVKVPQFGFMLVNIPDAELFESLGPAELGDWETGPVYPVAHE